MHVRVPEAGGRTDHHCHMLLGIFRTVKKPQFKSKQPPCGGRSCTIFLWVSFPPSRCWSYPLVAVAVIIARVPRRSMASRHGFSMPRDRETSCRPARRG